jgi:two-component system LytT family response regulator
LNAVAHKKLRIIIADDEALARRGLRLRLQNLPDIDIVAEARSGREALKLVDEYEPDVLFLDIQMPGIDGFEVMRRLQPANMPCVIFVTAFDQFAISAFEANAIDYLLKPIDDTRLHQALHKVKEYLNQRKAVQHKRSLLQFVSALTGENIKNMRELGSKQAKLLQPQDSPRLAIKDGSTTTWVEQQEIEWIDAAGDYMCVHAGGKTHIMRKTMKQLERELECEFLQRIHRSTIVNVKHVKQMQSHINGEYFLTLDCGHIVKLSRTYKDKLRYFR